MIPTSRRKASKNKPLIIGAIVGVVAIICIVVIILVLCADDGSADIVSDGISSESQSTAGQDSMKEETDNDIEKPLAGESGDDVAKKKEYYIDFVDLAVLQNGGGSFDIHIRFPNGEDYVVVAHAVISDITEEGFFISLSDRENHMLSSARTDMDVYTGTILYLARCEEIMSEVTVTDYPWNQFVLNAHGLNEDDTEAIYARRIQLEENLVKFMNQTLNR